MAAILWIVCLIALPACDESNRAGPSVHDGRTVVVSIPPLAGLVRPLLPPDTTVHVLVPSGRSAHGYRPTPEDIAAIGRADAVFMVGLNLETGMARAVRGGTVITMADVLGIAGDPHAGHNHDDHSGHDHGDDISSDPHLWLDPVLAAQFVRALPDALPGSLVHDETSSKAEQLAGSIDAVDAAFKERLAPFKSQAIVTHHASFNRTAERYGLEVAAVLRAIETLEPSPADIANAVEAIRTRGVGAVFVEPQFGTTSATRVADAAGVELVTLDPLGDGDWIEFMHANLDALVEGLSVGTATAAP